MKVTLAQALPSNPFCDVRTVYAGVLVRPDMYKPT
jgi:hypothetical protein